MSHRAPSDAVPAARIGQLEAGCYDLHRPCRPAVAVRVTPAEAGGRPVLEPDPFGAVDPSGSASSRVAEFFGPFASLEDVLRWRREGRKAPLPRTAPPQPQAKPSA